MERIVNSEHIVRVNCSERTKMAGGPQDRAQALRLEAARCLEHAKVAANPKIREELIAIAARFHELANSTAAHYFGAIMQGLNDDAMAGRPVAQQQQQIQPKKEE
jgi:hypothetical protein